MGNSVKGILALLLSLLLLANGRTPTAPLNDVTQPTAPPVTEASPTPVASVTPSPGPHPSIGRMWADTSDAGHCEGYAPYQSGSYPPSLSWPVPGGVLHEGRPFRAVHTGLDITAPYGSAVVAAAPGVVVWAGWTSFGLGNVVAVSHGGGWVSVYGHLSAVEVDCWQGVGRGEVIGSVGMSGNVSVGFSHVHFEIRNGAYSYAPSFN